MDPTRTHGLETIFFALIDSLEDQNRLAGSRIAG